MKSTQQLELEGERTREQINATLDELRARLTPGQVLDEVVDYARATGGAEFARNLGRQVVENPLPVALMGAGLVWLMATGASAGRRGRGERGDNAELRDRSRRVSARARDFADSTSGAAADFAGRAKATAADARATVSDAADSVMDSAARASEAVRSAAADAGDGIRAAAARSSDAASSLIDDMMVRASSSYDRASRATRRTTATIRDSTAQIGRSIGDRGQQVVDFCSDQPLVLAGVGMAIGAAIGAALPASDAENRLMGEASDEIKDRMQRVAGKVKEGARATYDQVTEAASDVDREPDGDREGAKHESSTPAASGEEDRSTADHEGRTPAPREATTEKPAANIDDPAAMRGEHAERSDAH
jgi:uncharacterized protein YjbJ (UPF0337 family)